jgi:hypothetical protein
MVNVLTSSEVDRGFNRTHDLPDSRWAR